MLGQTIKMFGFWHLKNMSLITSWYLIESGDLSVGVT